MPDINVRALINNPLASGILTSAVVTFWYRAPEILLGANVFSLYIDVWSIGCIFAEMMNRTHPPFCGESEIVVLLQIFRCMGTPNVESWPDIHSHKYFQRQFPKWKAKPIAEFVPALTDEDGHNLLKRMLLLNPNKRITAKQALRHPYFSK